MHCANERKKIIIEINKSAVHV